MIVPYFDKTEIYCLNATVCKSIGKELRDKELVNLVHSAPDNIREIGYELGLCDDTFRDMMFVWLRQKEGIPID